MAEGLNAAQSHGPIRRQQPKLLLLLDGARPNGARHNRAGSTDCENAIDGKPEEIVNVAIYLASDESRWTNGAHFVIDGGISVNYF